jgi:hypothetical protein
MTYGINVVGPWNRTYDSITSLHACKFVHTELKVPYVDNLFLSFISAGMETLAS